MIQRRQTVFLLLMGLLNVALLFISSCNFAFNSAATGIALTPSRMDGVASTPGHMAAIYLNFALLVITFIIVFMYNRREMQARLCYGAAALWLVLGLMIAFCPFITVTPAVSHVSVNYLAIAACVLGIVFSVMAARLIKNDIELLRSADRIR